MSTLEANVRPDIDLKVVGQLVSAAGLLPGFPSETAIADFLVPVLHGIPGCQSVRFCFRKLAHPIGDAPEEACPICTRSLDLRAETGAYACGLVTPGKVRSYSLETVTGFYGHLLLAVEPEGGFENYAFLIRNLCNALATLLENRSQRVALLKANDDLEQRVEERTAELRQNLETAVLSRQAMLSALEDRQQAELALKESEYRYAMAQRAANIGTWDRNMQTGQLHWSERIAPLFGFAPGGFAGTYEAFLQCIHPEDRQAVIDAVDDSVSKHQVFSFEHRIVWPDGSIRWVSETGELIWDEQESVPVRMLGIVQNITERKQAEEKLRLAGIYNRSLLEASLDPLVTISSEGKITDVNDASVQATGVARESLIGTDFSDYFTEPEKARESYRRVFLEGFVRDYPLALRHASGRVIEVLYNATVYRDEQGQVLGVVAAARDISERKRAETAMRESEGKFRAIFDEAPLGVALINSLTGHIYEVNVKFAEIAGRARAEMATIDWMGITHPDDVQEDLDQMARLNAGEITGFHMNKRYRRPDGSYVWIHMTIAPITVANRTQPRHLCMIEDITERKQAEEKLRLAGIYNRSLLEASLDPLVTISSEGKITDVNEASVQATGVARENLIGTDFSDYFTDPAKARAGYHQVFREGFVRDYELELRSGIHQTTPVLYNATVYRTEKGEVIGVVAAARDITERKLAEQALQASEDRLLFALDEIETGAWDLNLIDHSSHRSLKHDQIFGYETRLPQWTYEIFLEHVLPEDRAQVDQNFRQAVDSKGDWHFECRIIRRDGQQRWILASGRHRHDPSGQSRRMAGIIQDITDRKRTDLALREISVALQHKNAELERFLYAASHDLKSPVVTVRTFLGYLEQDMAAGDAGRIASDVNFIRTAADKMARLLDDLLEMSRVGRVVGPPVRVTFRQLVDDALAAVAGQIAKRGVTVMVVGDGAVTVFGDRMRLAEVFQNLLDNACKFMGEQQAPRIEVGVEARDAESVFFVRDNGIGIDPRFQAKAFNLFEKLEPKTEGSGLGLALVKRIVELHGGRIWVESPGVGQGACFYFTLPGAVNPTNQGNQS